MARAFLILLVLRCGQAAPVETPASPLLEDDGAVSASPPADPGLAFRDVTAWGGVGGLPFQAGMGISAGDVDGDGFDDLVIPGAGGTRVYKNRGDGSFFLRFVMPVDVRPGATDGAYLADFTGDRVSDIIALGGEEFRLWRGVGDGRFESTDAFEGLRPNALSSIVAFGDFDFRGKLDIYLGRLLPVDENAGPPDPSAPRDCQGGEAPKLADPPINYFMRRSGEGFADDALGVGLRGPAKAQAGLPFDVDHDGRLDLIIGTEGYVPDLIYLNEGNGHFLEAGAALGFDVPTSAMGIAIGDIDGDGDGEIFITDDRPNGGGLLWVRGDDGRYRNEAGERGLGLLQQYSGWGTALEDFDNDGDVDLFIVNSILAGSDRSYRGFVDSSLPSQTGRCVLRALGFCASGGPGRAWRTRRSVLGTGDFWRPLMGGLVAPRVVS